MAVTEASVVISLPVREVWGYITDAANLSVWELAVVDATQITDGPMAVGRQWRGTSRLLGIGWKWVGEFTRCDVNKTTAFKSVQGKLAFSNTTCFDEVGDGTRFTYRMESEPGLGQMFGKTLGGRIFGRLAEPIVAAVYRRAVRSRVQNLANVFASA